MAGGGGSGRGGAAAGARALDAGAAPGGAPGGAGGGPRRHRRHGRGLQGRLRRAAGGRGAVPAAPGVAGRGAGWENGVAGRGAARRRGGGCAGHAGRDAASGRGDVKYRTLVSAEQIEARLAEMGAEITADYAGQDLLLIAVLKGAFMTLADLARHIEVPLDMDFMAVSSYGDATKSSGVVRILKDLDTEISGRHVLIVEDIVDSGLTLSYLRRNLEVRGPASLEIATLLLKPGLQKVPLDVKYIGFEIPPDFVIGYGLDYYGQYRNLPYVAVLEEE
ncbi:MAG: hypoxanthine phosphoribosyltransferase [Actinobacteria bacterium]|nr:hypoxanthine phosphoribosyltransferase [Actinomycetota bacterium]